MQSQDNKDVILSNIIQTGDLSRLTPEQKVDYYRTFCERLGLDPISQPFKILRLNGKEILYCDRTGAQQLNKLHNVSHTITARENVNGCYVVTAQASTPDGRKTECIGAVPIENLKGDNLCNAMMKAETKSKRRATLDLLGLGILDETEADMIAPVEAKQPAPVAPVPETPKSTAPVEVSPMEYYTAEVQKCKDKAHLDRFFNANLDDIGGDQQIIDLFTARQFQLPYPAADLPNVLLLVKNKASLKVLYYANQDTIEKDPYLKAAFTQRKEEIAALTQSQKEVSNG